MIIDLEAYLGNEESFYLKGRPRYDKPPVARNTEAIHDMSDRRAGRLDTNQVFLPSVEQDSIELLAIDNRP